MIEQQKASYSLLFNQMYGQVKEINWNGSVDSKPVDWSVTTELLYLEAFMWQLNLVKFFHLNCQLSRDPSNGERPECEERTPKTLSLALKVS